MLADKHGRTNEVMKIYQTFLENTPDAILPMVDKNNTEEINYENPVKSARKNNPGLGSGIVAETANDPNAGRSGTRKFAHLTEAAFYRYAKEIDDGVQNSIPLAPGTAIVKESTANGRAGIGKAFYDLWQAAKRGDSIYKPFFVAWYEVDDYALAPNDQFKITKEEKEILKQCPQVTLANLMWRRLKILEYLNDEEQSILSPEERFKQDFPLNDNEAFLSTGAPVFDNQIVNQSINHLNQVKPNDIKLKLNLSSYLIKQFMDGLKLYQPPRQEKTYFIGADVAEGLAIGDASSAFIMDQEYNQVGRWHGKIDPDLYGHLLVALGELYNNALLIPENNNMGHTTITTIVNSGYGRLYKEYREDKVNTQISERYGWRTTGPSKNDMLNEGIKRLRDRDVKILDVRLLEEMSLVSRSENGNVVLNGRDRVVAYCLALMGRKHYTSPIKIKKKRLNPITGTGEDERKHWELNYKKKNSDIFG